MSYWDKEYEDRKKKREEQGDTASYFGSEYWARKASRGELEDIGAEIESRTKTWLENNNVYLQNYKTRFANVNGRDYKTRYVSDSSDWLSTITTQKNNFDAEAANIKSMLNQYKGYLSQEWADGIAKILDEGSRYQYDILKVSTDDNKYWSQWKTEDDYKQWQNEYRDYIKAQEERGRMEALDMDAATEELDNLKQKYEEGIKLKNEYGNLVYEIGYPDAMSRSGYRQTSVPDQKRERLAYLENELKQYGDLNALNTQIKDKEKYINVSRNIQTAKELEKVKDNPDFYEISQKGKELGESHGIFQSPENNLSYTREHIDFIDSQDHGADYHDQNYIRAKYMTDEETSVYNYYFGKGEKETAEKYLKSIDEELNSRASGDLFKQYEDNTATELIFSISSGLNQFADGMGALFSEENYIPSSVSQQMSGLVREDLGDVVPLGDGASLGRVAFDAGSSIGNMLPSVLASVAVSALLTPAGGAGVLGAGGAVAASGSSLVSAGTAAKIGSALGSGLLGASAAGNAYAEMLNLGYDKGQARSYSALVGASEAGLQYVLGGIGSLGKGGDGLFGGVTENLLQNIDNGFARVAIKLGGNMLSEGSEEYLQEIITPVLKNLAFGENNEFHLFTADAVYSGILGALTAGVLEGGSTVGGEISNVTAGREIKDAGAVPLLKKAGVTYSADTVAYRLANKVDRNTGAYTIGRLFHEVNATLSEQNKADLVSSLVKKGVTEENAHTIADAFSGVVNGVELNKAQRRMMEDNEDIADSVRDVLINPNSTLNQRNAAYNLMDLAVEMNAVKRQENKTKRRENRKKAKTAEAENAKQSFPSDKVRFLEVGDDPIFRDTDGKTVYEDEIPYKDENEKAVYEAAKELDNVRAANAMINTYAKNNIKNLNGENFSEFYKAFYNAGKMYDSYDALPETGYKAAANAIGEIAARSAFISGQNVANQRFFTPEAEAKVLKSGGVLMNTSKPVLDDSTNFMLQVVDAVGKKYNRVFEVRDDLGTANGYYRESDNRIVLSLRSQDNAITRVAGHELTHFIKKNSPEIYQQIADVVLTALKADSNYDYEGRAKWLKEHNPNGDVDEEIVAESMFDALSNETTVKELLKTESRTFFEKVKDWIDDFIGFLDDTIKKLKNRKYAGAEIRALEKDKKTLKEIRDLFYQALEETKSVGNTESVTSEQKFSIKDIENYSETAYNQYGWAVVNDVLSRTEYRKLNEQFAAIAHGGKFEKTKDGYYVIPVGEDDRPQNAFVFINGTISKPVIGSIMIIDVDNEMELDDIRGVFKYERSYKSAQIAENIFGSESVWTYHARDFESYRALQRQASEMRRGVRGDQGLSESGRGNRDDQEAVRRDNQSGQGRGRERGGNRYSIKEAEEQVTEKALLRENEHLKRLVADVQKAIKKERLDIQYGSRETRIIEETARNYKRKYQSDLSEERIEQMLRGLYERISSGDFDSYTAFEISKSIAKQIVDSSETMRGEKRKEYDALRKYLHNHPVCIPISYKSDPFYKSVRRGLFGRIRIAEAGVPLDQYIESVKNEFPNFISNPVLETDSQMFEELFQLSTEAHKLFVDGKDRASIINNLALDILQDRVTIPKQRSFGDTWYNEFKRVRRELSKELDNMEALEGQFRDKERKRIQKEEHDSLVRGIARSVNNLSKRFLYPTDKQNIPIAYRKWVGEVLSDIDVSKIRLDSVSKKNAELQEMMKHISNMANWRNIKLTDNQDSTIDESLEIDPEAKITREAVRRDLDHLYELNGNRPVDLSKVDNAILSNINNLLQSTLRTVTNYNKVLSKHHRMTISQMGEKTIADNNTKRGNAFTHALKKIFQIDAASLETYLYGLGDVGADIWKMFRQGETDKVNCIRSAQSFVESVYADMPKDFRKSLNSKELITYEFKNGSVSFTKQQLMELYALSRRAQAMQHIENGGIITGDIPKAVAVTREELNKLFDKHLTDVEKDFAVRLQRYLSTEVAKWGNSVTRREFGYDKFTEEFYWPISVDKDTVKTTDKNASEDNVSMWAIRNTGMTKAVNEKATNAIYIHNLMDTFSNHVVEMATYNGYSLVIRDVMGWFNYNGRNGSVKGAIRNAYGSDKTSKKNEPSKGSPGAEYFLKFMKDLNGGQGFDNTTAGNMVDRMASKAKVASVGANLRVIVQQPTAIVRAFDVVEAKYFFPNGKAQKQAESEKMHLSAYEEAARYSTAAQLKAWGFRENGISTQFSKVLQDNATLKEKVTDVALWGAEKADAIMFGRIWNACKRKIAAENPSIDTKSEEFFQMSGKLMDDVCYQTQVFDTLLCRTQNMRSKHSIVRILTAFTAEPAKSYNMLLRAFMSGSKKEIGKVIFLTTLSSVLATAAGSFVSAGRDDDDYKTFWEKYLEAFGGDILDSVNPLSSIPFMSELLNRVMGSDYDTPEFYEQAVENTQSLLDYIYKCFSGETDFDFIKFLDKLSKSVSTLTGIPFSNVLREARTIWNNMPFVERDHKSRTSDYYVTKDSALYDDLLSAMEKGDQDAIDRVKDELIARGKSQKQLNSGLKSVLKEKYEDEVTDAAEARQEGNTSRYEQLVNALSKKTGMNVTLVAQSVESVRKKTYEGDEDDEESDIGKTEEKKTRLYSMTDANRALESNNLSSAQRIINQEYAYKVDEYLAKGEKQKDAETKARSSIKDSITTEWKDRFLAAGLTERSKIRSKLHAITVGGKKIYTNDDMARWIKSNK